MGSDKAARQYKEAKKKPRRMAGLFADAKHPNPVLLGDDVSRAGAFLALLNVEGDGLAFSQ